MISIFPLSDVVDPPPVWIDLQNADEAEVKRAEALSKLRAPTREALSEIERSSRVFFENDALYLSMPLITPTEGQETVLTPLGFVMTKDILLTVRFGPSSAIQTVAEACKGMKDLTPDDLFARIIEAMVDRAADRLEQIGANLDEVSRSAFHADEGRRRNLAKASDSLRAVLRKIGQTGDRLSQIRDTLLGLDRITAYIIETPGCGFVEGVMQRLRAAQADVRSLNGYEEHLANKVQFLLDATLGFISIEQNDIVKILTVVSVVGVPPVLIAGVYGMNFKNMPELSWAWGYPYSLILMVVSGLVPLIWFKWRGWM